MTYESTITFTLDTICPWTYLAFKRLLKALEGYRTSPNPQVSFHIRFSPYQLYPDFSQEGEPKREWYMNKRYQGSEELIRKYEALMMTYGEAEGIGFKWGGTIANTRRAHRLIWWVQDGKNLGDEKTLELVEKLYHMYFEEEKHPSNTETLVTAATTVGIDEEEARKFVEQPEGEGIGWDEVQESFRENAGNGVDSVPYVVFEGRRRDFTLTGAKETAEYTKTMDNVSKESG